MILIAVEQYDFLIHAMLALGASHLNMLLGGTYLEAAIQHRVTAIKGLNKFLSSAHLNLHNADAAFAATLILAFQSHQMGEGLIEFLTMVRGCHLVGVHAMADFDNSLFRTFEREYYVKSASHLMKPTNAFARFGPEMVRGFCESAKKMAPLCTSVQDLEYLALLQRVATATVDNPLLGYREHTRLHDRLGWSTPEEFSRFIDPHNYPARLLILHMLILDNVMDSSIRETSTATTGSSIRHTFVYKPRILLVWAEEIANSLPAEYVPYSEWPVQFARRINRNQQQLLDWPETASASAQANVTEIMI
ncbi:hypothetical protein VHEMI03146 [[Torrubiella] hemipterigena]|uniref:C6 transcription factor n=1 Tax=[Torrubiella] hemipterigena TaxID=1531966 RepID=A0A0A1SRP6_9HYPO|nr:hypothetical protein VHEMI03146 [[Torrubiella] hemipterigena]